MSKNANIFDGVVKAYDVRGTVPEQLNATMCFALGVGFGRFVAKSGATRALLARDMRPTGVELSQAFTAGLQSTGVQVTDIGTASTDMLYYATGALDAPGVVFTASHNPAAYNGIKMCMSHAAPIGEQTGLFEIRDTAITVLDAGVDSEAWATTEPDESVQLLDQFADHVRSFVDLSNMRPLRVVADCANGMGGLVAPAVFAKMPVELDLLYPELDGTFPNHPADPLNSDNLKDLQARVLETGADVGLAFDGDADRVFLVDDKAQLVSGSLTTAMVAAALLQRPATQEAIARGETVNVIHNVICSKSVAEVIRENGGTPIRTRVGHSFIKKVMGETNALFGGEHSGHYYFRDNFRADSGIIAAVTVLGMLGATDQPLSELRRPFDRYVASGEINSTVADPRMVIEQVAAEFSDATQDRLDGLTVDLGEWWFNLRPSNTEPLLRLNLEASTAQQCEQQTEALLKLIRG